MRADHTDKANAEIRGCCLVLVAGSNSQRRMLQSRSPIQPLRNPNKDYEANTGPLNHPHGRKYIPEAVTPPVAKIHACSCTSLCPLCLCGEIVIISPESDEYRFRTRTGARSAGALTT